MYAWWRADVLLQKYVQIFQQTLADDTHVKVHWWNTSDDKASHNGPVVQALSILIKWTLTE